MHGLNSHEAMELMRRRWNADLAQDPITQVIAEFQDRFEYHERHGEHSISAALGEAVGLLRVAIETIASEPLSYDEAALVSSLARGTIRNRESARDPEDATATSRGSVRIQNLPLRPAGPPTDADHSSEKRPRQTTKKNHGSRWNARSVAAGLLPHRSGTPPGPR